MPTDTEVARSTKMLDMADDLCAIRETLEGCENDDNRAELLSMLELRAEDLVRKVDPFVWHLNGELVAVQSLERQRQAIFDAFTTKIAKKLQHIRDMENIAHRVMDMEGTRKLEGLVQTIRLQKNPDSLFVLDANKVPARFHDQTMVVTDTVNKARVKAAIKAGEDIPPGVELRVGVDRVELK